MAFSETLRTRIQKKAGMACCICHRQVPTDVHHIIPQNEEGPDTEDNAAPLCPTDHRIYGDNKSHRRYITLCRDDWYEKVEGGVIAQPGDEMNDGVLEDQLLAEYTTGLVIYERPRATNKEDYATLRRDHQAWYEGAVKVVSHVLGTDAVALMRNSRSSHGNFKQEGGRPYGYEQWQQVLRDDLNVLGQLCHAVGDRSRIAGIAMWDKIERAMPELIDVMSKDLSDWPIQREFIILEKGAIYNCRGDYLAYRYNEHDQLRNKLRILENYSLIEEITYNNTERFVISEPLAEYLISRPAPPTAPATAPPTLP